MRQTYKYTKPCQGLPIRYDSVRIKAESDISFELIVTLGEMDLDDAFRVQISGLSASTNFADFLDSIFSPSTNKPEPIANVFDIKTNPDLPEIYDYLLDIFNDWQNHKCSLGFFINYGPEIALSDYLVDHLRSLENKIILDVVIEHRYTPIEYLLDQSYYNNRFDMMVWLKQITMLYCIGTFGTIDKSVVESDTENPLAPIIYTLIQDDMLHQNETTLDLTVKGNNHINHLIQQSESQIDQYDVFRDVLYDFESNTAMFNSGRGEDLRIPVYEFEGLNPLRLTLLRLLEELDLPDMEDMWHTLIGKEDFYSELLTPLVDHQYVENSVLANIIESGLAFAEESALINPTTANPN